MAGVLALVGGQPVIVCSELGGAISLLSLNRVLSSHLHLHPFHVYTVISFKSSRPLFSVKRAGPSDAVTPLVTPAQGTPVSDRGAAQAPAGTQISNGQTSNGLSGTGKGGRGSGRWVTGSSPAAGPGHTGSPGSPTLVDAGVIMGMPYSPSGSGVGVMDLDAVVLAQAQGRQDTMCHATGAPQIGSVAPVSPAEPSGPAQHRRAI